MHVVFLVRFTHAVRFDHLVVCSGKDLVDLWGGPLLCGPNPTSQYGQGSVNRVCEPGLPCYLITHLEKCKLFLRNRHMLSSTRNVTCLVQHGSSNKSAASLAPNDCQTFYPHV